MERRAQADVQALVSAIVTNILDVNNSGTGNGKQEHKQIINFVTGTGVAQIDRVMSQKQRALALGIESLDFHDFTGLDIGGGVGNDILGQPVVLAEIALFFFFNRGPGTLQLGGGGAATAWNSLFGGDDDAFLTVPAGGIVLIPAPSNPAYAVEDVNNHTFQVEALADTVYDWLIGGRSA